MQVPCFTSVKGAVLRAVGLGLLLASDLAFGLPALPSGDGLAAQYPDDDGISDHASVLFSEDFEAFGSAPLDWSNMGEWDNVYGDLVITVDPARVHRGTQALELTHTSPQSHGLEKELAGHETLFVRYYMKFHPQFPGCHHTGMTIRGGQPGTLFDNPTGQKPTGTDHFVALLDHLSPLHSWSPPGNASPGFSYMYCYHMDQESDYGDVFLPSGFINGNNDLFGPEFEPRGDVIPDLDRWYAFELMVQCNTPGERDGRVAFWIDGVLTGDFPNLRFRTIDAVRARYAILASYSSQQNPNKTLWYDDVVVATEYVGPMSTGGAAGAGGSAGGGTGGVGGDATGGAGGSAGSSTSGGGGSGGTAAGGVGGDGTAGVGGSAGASGASLTGGAADTANGNEDADACACSIPSQSHPTTWLFLIALGVLPLFRRSADRKAD
jgi:hypothetical protein